MINLLTESQIVKIWQHQLLDRTEFVTEGGEPIKIIYSGRINDDRGADFTDAVIATSRGVITGDIEVHVKSSDWQAHQHHHDPVYNRVILHVVMWHDTKGATNLHNGDGAPIIALNKYIKSPTTFSMPCHNPVNRLPLNIMAQLLDSAGEKRFLAKATQFEADLAQIEASQCLYQGIMGALGYSKNKLAFIELATRLPLHRLQAVSQDTAEECLAHQQALLLGTAGLLPSQRQNCQREKDKWVDKLERLWASSPITGVMAGDAWRLFKVRPNNFPTRRIAAMSYLILRYKEKGILEEVVNMIKEIQVNKGHHRLEKGLVVTTNGYWASHFDFGSSRRIKNPTLLGIRRAADIVVNVLLPFAFAWGKFTSQPELVKKAFDLYCRYPRLVVNSVERHMMDQLRLDTSLVNSARRQQGLIHIYNTLCTQGKCSSCCLSHLEARNYIQI